MPKRIARRLGNRGAVLALLGVVWVIMGTVVHPQEPEPTLLHERFPLLITLALWSLPGVLAIVTAFWQRWSDANVWALMILGPAVRLASSWWGWVTGQFPPGWKGFVVWVAVAILINRCAAGLDRLPKWRRERE